VRWLKKEMNFRCTAGKSNKLSLIKMNDKNQTGAGMKNHLHNDIWLCCIVVALGPAAIDGQSALLALSSINR
jgi:hypothetical protein